MPRADDKAKHQGRKKLVFLRPRAKDENGTVVTSSAPMVAKALEPVRTVSAGIQPPNPLQPTEFGPAYRVHTSSQTGAAPDVVIDMVDGTERSSSNHIDEASEKEKAFAMDASAAKPQRTSDGSAARRILSNSMVDEVVSSIEPLPEPTPRNSEPSQAGAYSVTLASAPEFRSPAVAVVETSPSVSSYDELGDSLAADVDSLVEASLVDDSELVHAERLKETPSRPSRKLLVAVCLVFVLVVVTVAVVTWLVTRSEHGQADKSTTTTIPPVEVEQVNATPSGQVQVTTISDRCIQKHQDLYEAVTAYYQDNSASSNVSQKHGWPIGTWCLHDLEEFASVLATNRSETLAIDLNFSVDIGGWDTSQALDFEDLFAWVPNLGADWGIDQWDVSRVTNMKGAFLGTQWNQEERLDLGAWNTSSATTFRALFLNSNVHQAGIGSWDTRNVNTIYKAFDSAPNFNEDISGWDTSSLKTLALAFKSAKTFNQPLNAWTTSSVTGFRSVFNGADKFNQPLDSWDVSRASSINWIFKDAASFNQDISGWNVSSAKSLKQAFDGAQSFSQDLCAWGLLLPLDAAVQDMFRGTACPNKSDPVLEEGGPFCFNCN